MSEASIPIDQPSLFGEPNSGKPPEDCRPAAVRASRTSATLLHGDFVACAAAHVADASIDVVVTSPPYNIGIKYSKYSDDLSSDDYLAWTDRWIAEVKRCLAPGGSFFLNFGTRPTEPWIAWDVAAVGRRHFHLQNVIHWIKSISIAKRDVGKYPGITEDVSVGHYKPINSDRFVNDQHEYIFHFTHEGTVELDRLAIGVPYQDASNITRWKTAAEGIHCRGNTWFMPYPTIKHRARDRPHPASFPPALPERCLRLHGLNRVRRVMDPFMGLGTTALAAAQVGKDCIGFEIDEAYLEAARQRLAEAGVRIANDTPTHPNHGAGAAGDE